MRRDDTIRDRNLKQTAVLVIVSKYRDTTEQYQTKAFISKGHHFALPDVRSLNGDTHQTLVLLVPYLCW